ncbi:MAG: hypothetical protein QNJ94_04875 [Alphaproteobacteria bacterium]|nr:hypothetical protein [Alphaproteobacteria bacterium]
MRPLLIALPVAAATALGGCNMNSKTQQAASFIGQPKTELLACAGQPKRTLDAAGREFLTYTATMGPNPSRVSAWCILTFTVKDQQITRWHGRWDGPLNDQSAACEKIMSGCS